MTRFASLGTGGGPDVWVRSRWVFNCYVFPTASDGAPLVIDCGLPSHAHQILRQFSPERATVVATHTHTDHVGGIPELSAIAPAVALPARAEAFARGEAPGGPRLATVASIAPVLRSQAFELSAVVEAGRATAVGFGLRGPYASPSPSPVYLADGPFDLAEGWEAIATPGHTDDSLSFKVPGAVFTGDALLIRGCGRADFQNGDPAVLYASITERLFALPDATAVYPGHDYQGRTASTIGEEKRWNPRLAGKRQDEFVALMNALGLPPPKKLATAVPANRACGQAS